LRQSVLTAPRIVLHEAFADERMKEAVRGALCQAGTVGEVAQGDRAWRSGQQSEELSRTGD
jgi:hypothetical protein